MKIKLIWTVMMLYKEEYAPMKYIIRPAGRQIARFLSVWRINPFVITGLDFILSGLIIVCMVRQAYILGFIGILVRLVCDTIDGELARMTGTVTRLGAYLDIGIDIVFWFLLYGALAYASNDILLIEGILMFSAIGIYTVMAIFYIPRYIGGQALPLYSGNRLWWGIDEISVQLLSVTTVFGWFHILWWVVIIGLTVDWICKLTYAVYYNRGAYA